jgi:hypothetical protein
MRGLIVASLLAAGAGCGLIDPNVTETQFNLPEKSYSFDASTFNAPAGITQEIPCGAGQVIVDCCNPPAGLPAPDCTATPLSCEQNENGMNICTATVTVAQASMLNLGAEVPQLSGFTGFVSIKIKRIGYTVTTNTLNIDLPDVALYLAPAGVMDPADGSARKFGTLPSIPAATPTAGDVILERDADAVFSSFTQDIATPFNVIATTTLRVTRSPTGRIDLTISGMLSASL